jgi:hypothetical protein
MNPPIDLVLSRLAPSQLRQNGRDRWRACCPAHGGSNPSTLSVGVGESGVVLLRCWHGCTAEQVAHALGLELSDLFPPSGSHGAPLTKRRLISAAQALELLHDEAQLVAMCAANIAHGVALTDDDKARVLTAAGRVAVLRDETMA